MKNVFVFALLFLGFTLSAQSDTRITTKKCIIKKGFHLRLKAIVNDSRCPEDVTCIWAGEVTAVIEIYNDRKLVEEKTLTFNSKNNEENILWLSKYYPNKVKTISVLPYPKSGLVVKPKKHYITIGF